MFENFYHWRDPKPISLRELTQRVRGWREGLVVGAAGGILAGFITASVFITYFG